MIVNERYYLNDPKGVVCQCVIRLFKINKGRVKVGTTLWFNLFGKQSYANIALNRNSVMTHS